MSDKIDQDQEQDKELPVADLLANAHELDKEAVQGIFKLKPVALTKLEAMLESKDSRTALQACRLILEYGNN